MFELRVKQLQMMVFAAWALGRAAAIELQLFGMGQFLAPIEVAKAHVEDVKTEMAERHKLGERHEN
jgi:hypothetical protein